MSDNTHKTEINIQIGVDKLLLFLWLVGWLFTIGYVGDFEPQSFWKTLLEGTMLFVFWPSIIGLKLQGLI